MAQHIQSSVDGHIAVHRYEDLAVIQQVIEAWHPLAAVELGTAEGGFAAFLTKLLREWDGLVLSVDKTQFVDEHFLAMYRPHLTCYLADILERVDPEIATWLARPNTLLYTDNGDKPRELELYVPLMPGRAMVGTHDYGTEVDPAWAEAFMATQGFRPFHHAAFEALAHPTDYPVSLTRFWVRDAA
jgi:hypothetical protein